MCVCVCACTHARVCVSVCVCPCVCVCVCLTDDCCLIDQVFSSTWEYLSSWRWCWPLSSTPIGMSFCMTLTCFQTTCFVVDNIKSHQPQTETEDLRYSLPSNECQHFSLYRYILVDLDSSKKSFSPFFDRALFKVHLKRERWAERQQLVNAWNVIIGEQEGRSEQRLNDLLFAFAVVLPLMKPHKVWGETFGDQKRYRLVC